MSRGRAALFLLVLSGLATMSVGGRASAASSDGPGSGVVVLLVANHVSFEDLMANPFFRGLARRGGVGLMSTHTEAGDGVAVAVSGVPKPTGGDGSLLFRVLESNGVAVCPFTTADPRGAIPGVPSVPPAACSAGPARLLVGSVPATTRADQEAPYSLPAAHRASVREAVAQAANLLGTGLLDFKTEPVHVLVVVPQPSFDMDQVGDEVTPLIVAAGPGAGLAEAADGPMRTITSDSTRQDGLVSNLDVAPTVLSLFGVAIPSEMAGQPIRVTAHGNPFALHRKHLEERRIRVPVQVAFVTYVSAVGVVLLLVLFLMGFGVRPPPRVARVLRFVLVTIPLIVLAAAAGGLLPRLTYPVVVPFILVTVFGLAGLAVAGRWRSSVGPYFFVGAVGLAFLLIDGVFGLRALRVPLLGGTMFDGVRFYGLPNVFLALLLASSLFVAADLAPFAGTVVLFGAGMFAGLPALGADVGGAATMFFAAGLWWAVRTRGRKVRWVRSVAIVAAVSILGVAVVLGLNRFLPGAPTHARRFVEQAGGAGGFLGALWRRLGVGLRLLNHVPAAYIPLVGLPLTLAFVLRRSRPLRDAFLRAPLIFDVLVVMLASAMVAYLANDTGSAAATPAFAYAMALLSYPVLSLVAEARTKR